MSLIVGKAYGIPTVALRFFNVYGPRQALSNPYTGVLAIFSARLLNSRPPLVFEDGGQQRDFVHVRDVAQACLLALQNERAAGKVFNVGSGQSRTILSIAADLADVVGVSQITPSVVKKYRAGDIRHCFANISAAESLLGYRPRVSFTEGVRDLMSWLHSQRPQDRAREAAAQLSEFGLTA